MKTRERGRQKKHDLGRVGDVDAGAARLAARAFLAAAAIDGLPEKPTAKAAPSFRDYVDEFWGDYARHWKPATQYTNLSYIRRELVPAFGPMRLDTIERSDVMYWRDGFVERQGVFNRTLPVLACMLGYAEQLGYRRKGSNPCRRMTRFKRELPERYLSAVEYRRLAAALREAEPSYPLHVAVLRLLVFTGARSGEITTLRWSWVQPGRLMLPDSKTGPKIIWLNRQAEAVLAGVPHRDGCELVFPNRRDDKPLSLEQVWLPVRRHAGVPDVRIHDLRHSFASAAIADGVPLATIGKLLGHVLPETTARYAHLADDTVADAAQRVSRSIAGFLAADQ